MGQPFFKATRRRNDEHQIENVGEKLHAMMPWISKGKMVDRARNFRYTFGGAILAPPRIN